MVWFSFGAAIRAGRVVTASAIWWQRQADGLQNFLLLFSSSAPALGQRRYVLQHEVVSGSCPSFFAAGFRGRIVGFPEAKHLPQP